MYVADLCRAMETIAPPQYAESWDNVGLLIGDEARELTGPVLLTIDLNDAVIEEAATMGCDAVIAYHPPIFQPFRRLNASVGHQRAVLRAIQAGLVVYSPHTALDAAPGGMTDWLADALLTPAAASNHHGSTESSTRGGADRRALRPHPQQRETEQVKIVTFVPRENLGDLRAALATAGAGHIGDYELCSFAVTGTGTFRGRPGTNPAIGRAESFEQVDEVRLEMVCARRALPIALQTLEQFHPYEEPAVDVYPLEPRPIRSSGAGRRLMLDKPVTIRELAGRIKAFLRVDGVKMAALTEKPIDVIGVCPGAGAELADAAKADGCQLYFTGEMRYHEVIAMLDAGVSIILAGHTNTERGYLPRLADRLGALLPEIQFAVSARDKTPFVIV